MKITRGIIKNLLIAVIVGVVACGSGELRGGDGGIYEMIAQQVLRDNGYVYGLRQKGLSDELLQVYANFAKNVKDYYQIESNLTFSYLWNSYQEQLEEMMKKAPIKKASPTPSMSTHNQPPLGSSTSTRNTPTSTSKSTVSNDEKEIRQWVEEKNNFLNSINGSKLVEPLEHIMYEESWKLNPGMLAEEENIKSAGRELIRKCANTKFLTDNINIYGFTKKINEKIVVAAEERIAEYKKAQACEKGVKKIQWEQKKNKFLESLNDKSIKDVSPSSSEEYHATIDAWYVSSAILEQIGDIVHEGNLDASTKDAEAFLEQAQEKINKLRQEKADKQKIINNKTTQLNVALRQDNWQKDKNDFIKDYLSSNLCVVEKPTESYLTETYQADPNNWELAYYSQNQMNKIIEEGNKLGLTFEVSDFERKVNEKIKKYKAQRAHEFAEFAEPTATLQTTQSQASTGTQATTREPLPEPHAIRDFYNWLQISDFKGDLYGTLECKDTEIDNEYRQHLLGYFGKEYNAMLERITKQFFEQLTLDSFTVEGVYSTKVILKENDERYLNNALEKTVLAKDYKAEEQIMLKRISKEFLRRKTKLDFAFSTLYGNGYILQDQVAQVFSGYFKQQLGDQYNNAYNARVKELFSKK